MPFRVERQIQIVAAPPLGAPDPLVVVEE